jgi:AcrR family transcriptional regulator
LPQVLKDEVYERIKTAALTVFAERGFRGATMPEIAARAGVAPANLYRYYQNKEALFDAVVPNELADAHAALLERSVRSLSQLATGPPKGPTPAMDELLAFWLANRHAVIVLLDKGAGTHYAEYGARFVETLVSLSMAELRAAHPGLRLSREARKVLGIVFDNTRRALATILATSESEASIREALAAFRSYQMGGIAAFSEWVRPGRR